MKKSIKLIIGVILIVLVCVFGYVKYCKDYRLTKVLEGSHNDYSLIISMVGQPVMPYGETKCRATFYQNGKKINSYDFSYLDDGANAKKDNFDVEWFDRYAHITIKASEEENSVATYDFYYIVD